MNKYITLFTVPLIIKILKARPKENHVELTDAISTPQYGSSVAYPSRFQHLSPRLFPDEEAEKTEHHSPQIPARNSMESSIDQ